MLNSSPSMSLGLSLPSVDGVLQQYMQRQRAIDDVVNLVLGEPSVFFGRKEQRRQQPAEATQQPPPPPPIIGWGNASTAHNSTISRK